MDIELPCPACGRNSVQTLDRLETEASFVCAGCGKTVTAGIDEIAKAVKAGQRALNATIRGIKKRPN
jgi:transcription elongation factor Elf1